ncbi:hypothetical protein QZH41_002937 [Actinostola sp. cb2023]|nr:hypothetical protein QZH41_002937 [Actinostola sp. cb2023]
MPFEDVVKLIKDEQGKILNKDDIEHIQFNHEKKKPPSYQIIGDNVDLYVKVKHMSSERQNKSIHWFGLNAVQDRVSGLDLPDNEPIKNILELENIEFLPSRTDNDDLLHDLIPLCARILIGQTNEFFSLDKYKVEVGKDFKRIVFYLCEDNEFATYEKIFQANESDMECSDEDEQIAADENLAKEMQDEWNDDFDYTQSPFESTSTSTSTPAPLPSTSRLASSSSTSTASSSSTSTASISSTPTASSSSTPTASSSSTSSSSTSTNNPFPGITTNATSSTSFPAVSTIP